MYDYWKFVFFRWSQYILRPVQYFCPYCHVLVLPDSCSGTPVPEIPLVEEISDRVPNGLHFFFSETRLIKFIFRFNLSLSWYTPSSFSLSTVTTPGPLCGGLACTLSCSTFFLINFTNNPMYLERWVFAAFSFHPTEIFFPQQKVKSSSETNDKQHRANGELSNGASNGAVSSKRKASDYYITPDEVRQRAAAAAASAAQCAD